MIYYPTVIYNKEIKPDIFEMVLDFGKNLKVKPGMFINLSVGEESMILKRPISICDYQQNEVKICYKVLGQGTKKLSTIQDGQIEVLAPLGNGFELVERKKVLIVGAGIGIPPMVGLIKALSGCEVTTLLAGRNHDAIIYQDIFETYGKVIVTTDDGSLGYKGNPIQYLEDYEIQFDTIYACGPKVLLEKLDTKYHQIRQGFLAVEERMACGIGVCMSCIYKTKMGYKRACVEGPVFKLGEIDYGFKR